MTDVNKDIITKIDCPQAFTTNPPNWSLETIYIPDPNFERFLSKFDSDKKVNGKISMADALKIDSVQLFGAGDVELDRKANVNNLQGIEYFKNLKYLNCIGTEIDVLDLRFNTKLEVLQFFGFSSGAGRSYSQGKVIVLGENEYLKKISFGGTFFSELDLRGIKNLNTLDVTGNYYTLKTIYISNPNAIKTTWQKPNACVYAVCK